MWEYRSTIQLKMPEPVIQSNTAERISSVSTYKYLIPDTFLKRKSPELLNNLCLFKIYSLPIILNNGYFMKKKKKKRPTRHQDLLEIFCK